MENENQNQNTNFEQQNVPEQNLELNKVQVPEPQIVQEKTTSKGSNSLVVILLLVIILMLGWFLMDRSLNRFDRDYSLDDMSFDTSNEDGDNAPAVDVPSVDDETSEEGVGTQGTLTTFSANGLLDGMYVTDATNVSASFALAQSGDYYRCPTDTPNVGQIYSYQDTLNSNVDFSNCEYVAPNLDSLANGLLDHSQALPMYGPNPTIEAVVAGGRNARLLTADKTPSYFVLAIELDEFVLDQSNNRYSFLVIETSSSDLIQDIMQTINF